MTAKEWYMTLKRYEAVSKYNYMAKENLQRYLNPSAVKIYGEAIFTEYDNLSRYYYESLSLSVSLRKKLKNYKGTLKSNSKIKRFTEYYKHALRGDK